MVIVPKRAQLVPSMLANPVKVLPTRCKRSQLLGGKAGKDPMLVAFAPTVARYCRKQPLTLGVAKLAV